MTYGQKNKDKTLYYLTIEHETGFMSMMAITIYLLKYADFLRLTPVIKWKNVIYEKDRPADVGDNIFEYFFDQPFKISSDEAMQSYWVAKSIFGGPIGHAITLDMKDSFGMRQAEEQISLSCEMVRKYIRLNAPTQALIIKSISDLLEGKKTLGIHVRGGDYKERFYGHPVPVEPSEHIADAKKAIEKFGFERIFLATDEVGVVRLFEENFGDKLVYYPIQRGSVGEQIENKEKRLDNRYWMGYEVCRDAYTLAACDGLIAGLAGVPYIAFCINGGKYLYRNLIDKGIYGVDVPHIPAEQPLFQHSRREIEKIKKQKRRNKII